MATASTTAWVLHDLGLAAGFGGTLFGQMALGPAVDQVSSKKERGKVLHKAWSDFEAVRIGSIATVAATWLAGRTFLSGDFVGRDVRGLVLTKDILMGILVASGLSAGVSGALLGKEHEAQDGAPIDDGSHPSADTPPKVKALQGIVRVSGAINIAAMAAVIGVTTVLAMKAGRSSKWSLLARLLP